MFLVFQHLPATNLFILCFKFGLQIALLTNFKHKNRKKQNKYKLQQNCITVQLHSIPLNHLP